MSVALYRKRPVEVEAIRYDGTNAPAITNWSDGIVTEFFGDPSIDDGSCVRVRRRVLSVG